MPSTGKQMTNISPRLGTHPRRTLLCGSSGQIREDQVIVDLQAFPRKGRGRRGLHPSLTNIPGRQRATTYSAKVSGMQFDLDCQRVIPACPMERR